MRIASLDVIALEKEKGCGSRPVIVRVNTDEGIYGYGEAAIAIGCGSTAAYELLKDMAPMIIGMDAMAHETIWEKLYKQSFWAQGNGAVFFSAISAIDIALWDIKGKALGVPVYQLLGGNRGTGCALTQASSSLAGERMSLIREHRGGMWIFTGKPARRPWTRDMTL